MRQPSVWLGMTREKRLQPAPSAADEHRGGDVDAAERAGARMIVVTPNG
jgi:hypothetical protein